MPAQEMAEPLLESSDAGRWMTFCHRRVFLEEAKLAKACNSRFASGTMQVMHLASLPLEAASIHIEESNGVAFIETFTVAVCTQLRHLAGAFMS